MKTRPDFTGRPALFSGARVILKNHPRMPGTPIGSGLFSLIPVFNAGNGK
jgi:hypothetical protein